MATTTSPVEAPQQQASRIYIRWTTFAIIALFLLIYLGSAFSPNLQDDADSTHAEAAREMLVRGDYVTLHINGVRYLEKAPLMYWAVAASYHIFGVNAFAVRVPTVVAMLLLVLLAMKWGRKAFGERAGVYAGLFVCTAAGYYLFTRVLIPEAILALLIATSMYSFLTAAEPGARPWRWYAGYACLALAVLTKGLLPLVVVGFPLIFYIAITGEWRRWREFRLPTGLLLFFAIATPWHILAGIRNPRFFWFYFVNEHFLRFLGERYPRDYNKLPAALYWSLHLIWLFPWSVFLPLAVRKLWRDMRSRHLSGLRSASFGVRTELLCWLWAGVLLTFFAFSTNQEYYTLPAYFPILLLLAASLAHSEEDAKSRWPAILTTVTAALCLAGTGILIAGLYVSRKLPYVSDIGTALGKTNLSTDTLSMGHMLDLTGQSFAALRLPTVMAIIALGVGALATLVLRLKRRHFASTWALALAMGLFLLSAHVALKRFDPYLSSKRMADVVEREIKPGDHVMIYGDQAFGSSLLFYLRRPVELVNGRTTSMWFGSTYPDAPHIFLDDAGLLRDWNSSERIFLFIPPQHQAHVDKIISGPKYLVAESSGKVIYSNQP